MLQLMNKGKLKQPEAESASACPGMVSVKPEIVDDFLEEEHGPFNKRSKVSPPLHQQWNSETVPPSQCNPLDEPSPLGLQLRKSHSLLDLIQMRLSQGKDSAAGDMKASSIGSSIKKEKAAAPANNEKLKASNFPASLLRIGNWEYKSRYEGDLVAKCYFAKHKLVWEVLEGGLKSKIEIQWSDIMALKANCPENGPGTLTVVLARQPLFFRETNPQPRKHTLWQATTDFTDGQASRHRQHFLQCPQGLLNKHFEKLIQCDMRLNFLSRQPEIIVDPPCFEPRSSIFDNPEESNTHPYGHMDLIEKPSLSVAQNFSMPTQAQSSSLESEKGDHTSFISEHISQEVPSPSSVMDTCAMEGRTGVSEAAVNSKASRSWDQIKFPGLHSSVSMSDLMNHIGNCLSDNPSFSGNVSECQGILEDITQYLLSDTQIATASDEQSLMSRVNSLCCLLQKDPAGAPNPQAAEENCDALLCENYNLQNNYQNEPPPDIKPDSSSRQPTGMSRKDSFGELLVHLPRITSLPKFLFNISEEGSDN